MRTLGRIHADCTGDVPADIKGGMMEGRGLRALGFCASNVLVPATKDF